MLTYHHVHLWHIFTYINPHIISFASPILISGARDNIFPSHITSLQYTSAVFSRYAPTHDSRRTLSLYSMSSYRRRYAGGQFVRCLSPTRDLVVLYHDHWSAGRLHPASSNWDIADVPYIFVRRNSPDLSVQVQ